MNWSRHLDTPKTEHNFDRLGASTNVCTTMFECLCVCVWVRERVRDVNYLNWLGSNILSSYYVDTLETTTFVFLWYVSYIYIYRYITFCFLFDFLSLTQQWSLLWAISLQISCGKTGPFQNNIHFTGHMKVFLPLEALNCDFDLPFLNHFCFTAFQFSLKFVRE